MASLGGGCTRERRSVTQRQRILRAGRRRDAAAADTTLANWHSLAEHISASIAQDASD